MKKIIIMTMFILSLQGCFFAGAAAGAAAVAVIYDHRKLEKIAKDQNITKQISDKIRANPQLRENSHIEVTTFNQVVLLTGETSTTAERQQVEEIVHNVSDVTKVYNQLAIHGPTSSLTHASDSWITTKIKTEMLATKEMKSSTIKVVTENGTVYLMGIVSHSQADMAVDIARKVSGVQKVVKIFNYTD